MDIQFYTDTKEAWEAMLADLYSAQVSIDIEQYIFMHDAVGERFIDALIQKARQDVSIRLSLDAVGSFKFYTSTLVSELRDMGIQIRFFNPVSPWRTTTFISNFFRDHRKIMIIDGVIAHLGGVGIEEKMQSWRDTHMRIVGPLVIDIREIFETMWKGMKRWNIIEFKRMPHFIKKFNLLTNAPVFRQHYIYQSLLARIRNAKKYVYLTTPYFVPDLRFFRAVRLAAKRGVDVRIVVPHATDHTLIDRAQESYFATALTSGVKIYLYGPNMMHAKTAVIDDTWATTGTFNLDSLSFFYNYEANVSSTDSKFIETLKKHFYDDLRHSRELNYQEWNTRTLGKRILELMTWPIHGIL